ncbi:hypothetical protein TMEN_9389 [Trichophyton mentagrophytes]|nr:hypothetical protein TMEN_9389 [Trichophyton mentagrophytes]
MAPRTRGTTSAARNENSEIPSSSNRNRCLQGLGLCTHPSGRQRLKSKGTIIAIYVDDILIIAKDKEVIKTKKTALTIYKMKDLGIVYKSKFPGIETIEEGRQITKIAS